MTMTDTSGPTRFATEIEIDLDHPEAAGLAFAEALASGRVISARAARSSVEGLDDAELRARYDALVEAVGRPIEIGEDYATGGAPTGNRWSEIRYDADIPDMVAFRHSKNAQPLHTDESYVSSEIGVMLFYCVNAAPRGGETVFVDGPDLVEHLRATDPSLLDDLLGTDVVYQKAGDAKRCPIIRLEHDGPHLNFNYFCIDPDQERAAVDLNARFHHYLEHILPRELVHPVGLRRGDSVGWRDHLVLHGRNAFEATRSGDRFIWKTGIVLDPGEG